MFVSFLYDQFLFTELCTFPSTFFYCKTINVFCNISYIVGYFFGGKNHCMQHSKIQAFKIKAHTFYGFSMNNYRENFLVTRGW